MKGFRVWNETNVVWHGKCIFSQSGSPAFKIFWGSMNPLMVHGICILYLIIWSDSQSTVMQVFHKYLYNGIFNVSLWSQKVKYFFHPCDKFSLHENYTAKYEQLVAGWWKQDWTIIAHVLLGNCMWWAFYILRNPGILFFLKID